MLLTNARLADDRLVDISIGPDSAVEAVFDAGQARAQLTSNQPSTQERDLSGHVVLPGFWEPHAHLDKALTADEVKNQTGDLAGAITAWLDHRTQITHDNYVQRATAAIDLYHRNGVRAIRTHVDLGPDVGTTGLEALAEVKSAVADRVHLELVGLPVGLTGPNSGAVIKVCGQALDLGLDIMGGVPHIEEDPARAIEVILELAGGHGRRVDIHADENLNPGSTDLEALSRAVIRTGFEHAVTASHCVALSMKQLQDQQQVAAIAAEAEVAVVALPHTNLYLQARDHETGPPRGLTPVAMLQRSGVKVVAGGDNLQDPFNPLGSADPLETAALMVLAGHVSPIDAINMVTVGDAVVSKGHQANLVAVPGQSLREVLAMRSPERLLLGFDV